ncbi:MAG: hypothetical protein HOE62_00350 [Alphaproteobacteria bacterium]|jgi:hypothetical protein|nr:hypothetical protein [Alphaproteobacteria bacterium]MBT4016368.1 hypothetical protein [Alphaproteobacteria bacterium]MBT4966215.1 hypothetical protein [Alphaproteobacteria bacterium]MBT5919883.1 hypothetical protein [Alphaproteobacteria bacterium]MBT6385642.1 hypothetical protein [Alphaproteobacteria bacterium]
MLFKLLKYGIIFGLPFLMFFVWAWIERRRAAAGQAPLRQTPWVSLSIVGLVLMITALLVTGLDKSDGKKGKYIPPKMVNGVIEPGRVE